ncbi:hypothetical protein YC2023_000386 [Brassica napus]
MLGGSKAPPMAKQNATSGTLASREFYKEYSQPSNALKKTTVEMYVCVPGFSKKGSFATSSSLCHIYRNVCFHERDDHGPDGNGDVAELAKDVAPSNGESMKKKARQE